MTTNDDKKLDNLFAEMRADDALPSEGLLDRIMADADGVLADQTGPVAGPQPVARPQSGARGGVVRGLLDAIGGWPAFGGLVAATMTGLWIGVAPPDGVSTLAALMLGDTVEVSLFGDDVFGGLEAGL